MQISTANLLIASQQAQPSTTVRPTQALQQESATFQPLDFKAVTAGEAQPARPPGSARTPGSLLDIRV